MKNNKIVKSKRKGFTLVELLAVLLVMAILALIAVPMVINVINKARKQAYQRSVESYVRSVENAILAWSIDNPNKKYSSEKTAYNEYIDIKGDQVTCKTFNVDADTGKLTLGNCTTDKSIIKYPDLSYQYFEGKVSEEKYKFGYAFTLGGAGYHIISVDPSKDYVIALKDLPLTATEIKNLGYSSSTNNLGQVYYDNIEYEKSSVKPIVDEWSKNYSDSLALDSEGYTVRLIKLEELISIFGYKQTGTGNFLRYTTPDIAPEWLESKIDYNVFSSWTMTPVDNKKIWVFDKKSIDGEYIDSYAEGSGSSETITTGHIRPVINILKNKIPEN